VFVSIPINQWRLKDDGETGKRTKKKKKNPSNTTERCGCTAKGGWGKKGEAFLMDLGCKNRIRMNRGGGSSLGVLRTYVKGGKFPIRQRSALPGRKSKNQGVGGVLTLASTIRGGGASMAV